MTRIRILALLATVTLLCSSCGTKQEKKGEKTPVPVKVARSAQKNVPLQIKAIGTIEALSTVAVKSQISGQIAKIHFSEGGFVEKDALLISIDQEPFLASLNQAEANLAKNQAQAKFANDQVKRYEQLLKDGIVTRDQYEMLQANAASLAAGVAADRAAVKSAKIQLGYCSIRSPIAGRTGTIALHPGNLVKANDLTIVTVNQISPISATFSIPEKRLTEMKQAMASGQLKIEAAVPGEAASSENGTVSFLDNTINSATGTIKLKGTFANKSRKLWPGQFTDLLLTLANRQNVVVIPTTAIQTGQQGEFVFVVRGDSTVDMRPVTSSTVSGDETVIDKGLTAGETVVTTGQLRLTPGAKVSFGDKSQTKDKNAGAGKKP